MKVTYRQGNVIAHCPDCGCYSTFEHGDKTRSFGSIVLNDEHEYLGQSFSRILYMCVRCASCHRGGLAKVHDNGHAVDGLLEEFYPVSPVRAQLPANVPIGIKTEYREAELCAAFGAYRAASALFRSMFEKTLRLNGYVKGSLAERIDQVADDGVITEARRNRAHDDIRVLGNDVLHDDWREVTADEVEQSAHYAQRILEDMYDDREAVESILVTKGRMKGQSQIDGESVQPL